MKRLIGSEAIEYALKNGLLLHKYNDPIEGARHDVIVEEAEEICREDDSLIYIDVPEHGNMQELLDILGVKDCVIRFFERPKETIPLLMQDLAEVFKRYGVRHISSIQHGAIVRGGDMLFVQDMVIEGTWRPED